jgi:hypothetical protein
VTRDTSLPGIRNNNILAGVTVAGLHHDAIVAGHNAAVAPLDHCPRLQFKRHVARNQQTPIQIAARRNHHSSAARRRTGIQSRLHGVGVDALAVADRSVLANVKRGGRT